MKVFNFFLFLLIVIGLYALILLNSRQNSETKSLQSNNVPSVEMKQEISQEPNQDMISDMLVTRQEFLVSLAQRVGLKPENGDVNFSDISNNSPDLKYIYPLSARGIITGYPDGTLMPYEYITVNEAEIMKARLLDLPAPLWDDTSSYLNRKQMYNMLSALNQ